jgi:hypothetical protein
MQIVAGLLKISGKAAKRRWIRLIALEFFVTLLTLPDPAACGML